MTPRKPSTKIAEPGAIPKDEFIRLYGLPAYTRLPPDAKLLWNKLLYVKEEFDHDHCCD